MLACIFTRLSGQTRSKVPATEGPKVPTEAQKQEQQELAKTEEDIKQELDELDELEDQTWEEIGNDAQEDADWLKKKAEEERQWARDAKNPQEKELLEILAQFDDAHAQQAQEAADKAKPKVPLAVPSVELDLDKLSKQVEIDPREGGRAAELQSSGATSNSFALLQRSEMQ